MTDFDSTAVVMEDIRDLFDIELQTARQRETYYLYEALLNRDHVTAYKHFMNQFDRDEGELFTNTSATSQALYYVNEPREALNILKKIPWGDIDYSMPDNKFRITMGIQANFALEKY